jgi:hypothetical protein
MDWRELGALKRERAAEVLGGISPQTVDDMIRAGKLRSSKAGRCVLVSVQSIRSYLGEVAPLAPVSAPAEVPAAPPAPVMRPQLSDRSRRVLAEARRRLG